MVKCLLLLPTQYNNGQPVESSKIDGALARIDSTIGGHTLDGVCTGAYRMPDGTMAQDVCLKIWAVCEQERLPELRGLAAEFAIDFDQDSIYFEQTATTVEFIRAA